MPHGLSRVSLSRVSRYLSWTENTSAMSTFQGEGKQFSYFLSILQTKVGSIRVLSDSNNHHCCLSKAS